MTENYKNANMDNAYRSMAIFFVLFAAMLFVLSFRFVESFIRFSIVSLSKLNI